jgi:glycosyltransferase involved in cell wall biosynthesis
VVSSSSAFAHLVRVPRGVPHICYCHAPFRYAWDRAEPPVNIPAALRPMLGLVLYLHRAADRRAASRIDRFVANSKFTQDRIRRLWGKDAVVVHPPVDVNRFTPEEPEDYVLFVGELVSHKRPHVAIAAAAAAGRRIKVVGGGAELSALRARYGSHAEFLGRVSDAELATLYQRAAAVIIPNVEEFSIVAVEAQAAGRPVVGLQAGGLLETVSPGRSGILVPPGDDNALRDALASDFSRFDSAAIRDHAQQFSSESFATRMAEVVDATSPRRLAPAAA